MNGLDWLAIAISIHILLLLRTQILIPAIDHFIVMGSHIGDRIWNAAVNCIDALARYIAEPKFQDFHAWVATVIEQFTGLGIDIAQVFCDNRKIS